MVKNYSVEKLAIGFLCENIFQVKIYLFEIITKSLELTRETCFLDLNVSQAIHQIDVKETLLGCISTNYLVHILNLPSLQKKSPKASETLYFFLSGFSFTDTDDSQDRRGREGTIFYSSLPLLLAH